jgi:hypothetical protein
VANLLKTNSNVNPECGRCHYALFPNTGRCTNESCVNHQSEQHTRIPLSLGQLMQDYKEPDLFHGRRWGNWHLDTERLCLVFKSDRWNYEVDIERIGSSAAMLDWIFQVRQKGWADAKTMYDLLNALRDIFDPQQSLCSWGQDKRINATEFLTLKVCGRAPKVKADPIPISEVRIVWPVKTPVKERPKRRQQIIRLQLTPYPTASQWDGRHALTPIKAAPL